MNSFKAIKFDTKKSEFAKVLRKRVNQYFKEKSISKHSNFNMVFKTFFMMSLYFIPYSFLVSGFIDSYLLNLVLWSVMGLGMAGIGMSVMHDANHGSYSKNKRVNDIIGQVITLIGGNAVNWKLQHNVLHHTYTNISGMDEDLESDPLMRFSPDQEVKKFHKFQHFYAWFLYGLMTISWSVDKDFSQLFRYRKKGLLKLQNIKFNRALTVLISTKILYYCYAFVLPMIFAPNWWIALIGYLIMHFVAGFVLAIVFQCAHVIEKTDYPKPLETGNMETDFFVHQLNTTANFGSRSRFFSWFVGGLNFQVEHHLFPNICHIHYKKISPIVKKTALEYGYPYHSFATFFEALSCHTRHLKQLGRA
ncbi:MAG: acyl-CoA desaturase [Crocinitomicaceae bacterium]|nr:acyl-CoA desaturase [Crocinitomicaceae bacterium]